MSLNPWKQTVLVVAAHPDDEVLGCGGTLARHAEAGSDIQVIFVADGERSRGPDPEIVAARRAAAEASLKTLGIAAPPVFLGFEDQKLDAMPLLDITQAIEAVKSRVAPAIVYTHHGSDLNLDHRIVHQAAVTACRPAPGQTVRSLLAFEVASSTEWAVDDGTGPGFRPARFVNIEKHFEQKLAALDCYQREMRHAPHPRSAEGLRHLASWRGMSVGYPLAEAFMLLRDVLDYN